jgi:hypothetical protein
MYFERNFTIVPARSLVSLEKEVAEISPFLKQQNIISGIRG